MRIDNAEIASVGELIERLTNDMPADQPTWFRGHADNTWQLDCYLARDGGMGREMPLIKRFKQNALPILPQRPGEGSSGEWEWLFIMQHHGLPTRLLDWSESPLIGLFFVVNDTSKTGPGCLWAMLPNGLNGHAKLENPVDIPGLGDDAHLDEYLPSAISKQPVPRRPLAVIALRNTPRIQMQQGVFTVFHKDLEPLDAHTENDYLWKYTVPPDAKERIRRELEVLGIHKLSLFPELMNVAEHARGMAQ